MSQKNMYKLSKKQWNPFVGCEHGCIYCVSSFQRQLKRQGKRCRNCYNFTPHEHPSRLSDSLPNTKTGEFIFTCSNGDVTFSSTPYLKQILQKIEKENHKTFLIQSKNPKTFERVKFPSNVILGTTIETNRDDLYEGISEAPRPSQRYKDFLAIRHPLKMVTIEPVLDFDVDVIVSWIKKIDPCTVWIGYDSKKNNLPEPELRKVKILQNDLEAIGFTVIPKTIRKAWWEQT